MITIDILLTLKAMGLILFAVVFLGLLLKVDDNGKRLDNLESKMKKL